MQKRIRKARIIPFGYEQMKDRDLLVPIKDQIYYLKIAKVLFENNEMSLRRVAKWVTERTGRYISHVGIYKIFNKGNNKKIKNTIFPQIKVKKIEPKITINKVDSNNIRLTIDINIR
jgi:hypothetical protein